MIIIWLISLLVVTLVPLGIVLYKERKNEDAELIIMKLKGISDIPFNGFR